MGESWNKLTCTVESHTDKKRAEGAQKLLLKAFNVSIYHNYCYRYGHQRGGDLHCTHVYEVVNAVDILEGALDVTMSWPEHPFAFHFVFFHSIINAFHSHSLCSLLSMLGIIFG